MDPLTLELLYLIENGPRITLVGKDPSSGEHAAIQVDLRPCAAFWASLAAEGTDRNTYTAEGVRVTLGVSVGDAAGGDAAP